MLSFTKQLSLPTKTHNISDAMLGYSPSPNNCCFILNPTTFSSKMFNVVREYLPSISTCSQSFGGGGGGVLAIFGVIHLSPFSLQSFPDCPESYSVLVQNHLQSVLSHPPSVLSHPQSVLSHPQSVLSHPSGSPESSSVSSGSSSVSSGSSSVSSESSSISSESSSISPELSSDSPVPSSESHESSSDTLESSSQSSIILRVPVPHAE